MRLTQPWIIVRGADDAPPVGMLLLPRHLIKGEAGLQIGVFGDFFLSCSSIFYSTGFPHSIYFDGSEIFSALPEKYVMMVL